MAESITFTGAEFAAQRAAEKFLHDAGFSVAPPQHGAPRGIMFGACKIAKWRGLTASERHELHGRITGDGRAGPTTISILDTAPHVARVAFHLTKVATEAFA